MTNPASRLIADVPLGIGSPLEPKVAGFDFSSLQPLKFLLYSADLRYCKILGGLKC